jgi:hypothetical protein
MIYEINKRSHLLSCPAPCALARRVGLPSHVGMLPVPRNTQTTAGLIQRQAQPLPSSIILHLSSGLRVLRAFVVKCFLPGLPVLPVILPLRVLCAFVVNVFSSFDRRPTTTAHQLARPSAVCRLTSYV